MKFIVLIVVLACLAQTTVSFYSDIPACGQNNKFGSIHRCRRGCDNRQSTEIECSPSDRTIDFGCKCCKGYLPVLSVDRTSPCVKPADCPRSFVPESLADEMCNRNNTYGQVVSCRTGCDRPVVYQSVCHLEMGCGCKENYIPINYADVSSPCVDPIDCPRTHQPDSDVGETSDDRPHCELTSFDD